MITAKFGTKSFEVTTNKIYTPDGLSYSEEMDLEETAVSGKKPTVTFKGIKLQPLSFGVKLDHRFVDVSAEIAFWKKTLLAKKSQTFKFGSQTLGKFFLTKYDVKEFVISKKGVMLSAYLTLTFTEDGNYTNTANEPKTTTTATTTAKKVTTVKASTAASTKIRKGSTIKVKSGARWYYTAEGALKKSGKSGKAYVKNMTITYTYSKNGKIVCVNPQGLGWLKVEDVTVVKY